MDERTTRIRAAHAGELERLREIERAAGAAFRALGMDAVAVDEPFPLAVLDAYRRAGRLWVAVEGGEREGGGEPVAYLLLDPVDGNAHVEQVSVHPDRAHRRIGRALLDHAAAGAAARGVPALTLCTFADVPWNAPYYERCGFRRLSAAELTPGLRALRAQEAAHGLDRWPRVCMRRDLAPHPPEAGAAGACRRGACRA